MSSKTNLPEILKLVEDQKTIKLATSYKTDVERRLNKAIDDRNRLAGLLNDKYESVEALESGSLRNLFLSILENRELQLEMERQEYLQVVLQYNEAKKQVEVLEFEVQILEKQIALSDSVDAKLNKAISEHRQEILLAYPKTAQQIIVLEEKIQSMTANNKELIEAKAVAKELLDVLAVIITNLSRASDWGNWEGMQLSHKIATKSKNLFVDKALSNVYIAQNLFEKLEKELKDIHDHQHIRGSYHFHDFGNFAEVYYNRLIADWVIQERIKNSKLNVEGVNDNVQLIAATLDFEIKRSVEKINALEQQKDFIIRKTLSSV